MPGLRERKKARTRAAIQRHALRLFRQQGYEATTVTQIADAAEVSESTFFRYFPTKEDLVLWDEFDPLIVASFQQQPAELGPVAALRAAMHHVFGELTESERAQLRGRLELLLAVPRLRATMLDQISGPMRVLAEAVAQRTARQSDDLGVRVLVGAVIGVGLAAMFAAANDPKTDMISLIDNAMAQLDAGLPL